MTTKVNDSFHLPKFKSIKYGIMIQHSANNMNNITNCNLLTSFVKLLSLELS